MAVERSFSTNKAPKPIVDSKRSLSKEAFTLRWLIWITATVVSAVIIRFLMPEDVDPLSRLALVLASSVGCCAALVASIHCFVTFLINLKVQRLIEAIAFSSLCGGIGFQTITDFTAATPIKNEAPESIAWLIATLLFLFAVNIKYELKHGGSIRTWARTILSATITFPIPLFLLPYGLQLFYHHIIGHSAQTAYTAYIIEKSLYAFAVLFAACALTGYYRRVNPSRQMARLMCYFLAICGLGIIYELLSENRFDQMWLLSHILLLDAWFVLIGKFAMQNSYAHKEAADRLDEVEALHQISWSLVGAVSVAELLGLFAQSLGSRLQAKNVVVYLADDNDEALRVAAAYGSDEFNNSIGAKFRVKSENRFPGFHSGHTARAFITGESQIVNDIYVDVEFIPWRVIAVENGCAVSLPLTDRDKAIGVINLYFSDCSHLTPQRLRLLTTIAAAATPAIENALAKEAMQARADYSDALNLAA